MRFIAPFLALFAAVATAQQNAINVPPGGLQVVAGEATTITWTNPSSGTITIKLQQGSVITPDSGITVENNIEASLLTATFVIPADAVNSAQYNFEIIDNTNPNNYNFSPGFTVQGATGTGIMSATTVSAAATASVSSSARSASSTGTSSDSTSLPSLTTSSSESSASTSTSTSSPTNTLSTVTISSSSAPTSEPTAITNNNGASSLQIQSGLLAAMVGIIAVF